MFVVHIKIRGHIIFETVPVMGLQDLGRTTRTMGLNKKKTGSRAVPCCSSHGNAEGPEGEIRNCQTSTSDNCGVT